MDIDSRSTHLGYEDEEAEADNLKSGESVVVVVEEATEDEAQEI